jgi:hypothetical protein
MRTTIALKTKRSKEGSAALHPKSIMNQACDAPRRLVVSIFPLLWQCSRQVSKNRRGNRLEDRNLTLVAAPPGSEGPRLHNPPTSGFSSFANFSSNTV